MSWSAILRSVSVSWRRALTEVGCIVVKSTHFVSKRRCFFNTSTLKMLQGFEERVFQSKNQQARNIIKPTDNSSCNKAKYSNGALGKSNEEIESEYKRAIETLNALQSHAITMRYGVEKNAQQTGLMDTPRYLERSGFKIEDLDQQSFIHVAGTKGKGSTCAITESILRSNGVKTAFFSSPHLVSVTERLRINGEPIRKEKFTKAFWQVYNRLEETQKDPIDMPAYFQFLTLLSFHIFRDEKVDVIVLETGIGGELDCTNIVRNTKTVGITSLGLEHTEILGNTLNEIAWQKAGIIKPGSHVYTSVKQPECLQVIRERAEEKNATMHVVPDFSEYMRDPIYKKQLEGLHNLVHLNGSLAIQLAYDWLRQHKNTSNLNTAINELQITKPVMNGLENFHWPGRCQRVQYKNFIMHLDGAHTVESIDICIDWFTKVTEKSEYPKVLIFNMTGERDGKILLDILRQGVKFNIACFVPNFVTSMDANDPDIESVIKHNEQMERVRSHADYWRLLCSESNVHNNSKAFESITDSFTYLRKHFGTEQNIDVLVTGSLYLLGATIHALK